MDREREVFQVTLRAEVMRAFDTLLTSQRALDRAEENEAIAAELRELIQRRFDAGETAGMDLVRAQVDTLQATRAVHAQRRRIGISRTVLDALTGGNLPPGFAGADDFTDSPPAADDVSAMNEAMTFHPILLRLEALRIQRQRELARERVEWIPQPQPGVFFDSEDDARTLGASVAVEIPLWNRNQGGIAAAQAALELIEAEAETSRLEIRRDVLRAVETYESAREQIAAFNGGLLKAARQVLEIQRALYEQGEVDLLQVLDARRTAQTAENEYIQALSDAAIAREDLLEAVGVGDATLENTPSDFLDSATIQ